MAPRDVLEKIYDISVARTRKRIHIIEQYLGIGEPSAVSIDDTRNESTWYQQVAHEEILTDLFEWLLSKLRRVKYDDGYAVFEGLGFLQEMLADLLWRYGCSLSQDLEEFTRDFDRLDVPGERRRLYELAQRSNENG